MKTYTFQDRSSWETHERDLCPAYERAHGIKYVKREVEALARQAKEAA